LFVANSRHLGSAKTKTPKNLYKIPESAVSCTLLMSGFQIFAADAAFQNRTARDFFTHPTKKNALSFPDFCQKACSDPGKNDRPSRVLRLRASRPCQEMVPRPSVRRVSPVCGSCSYFVRVHPPPPVPRRRTAAPVTRLVWNALFVLGAGYA